MVKFRSFLFLVFIFLLFSNNVYAEGCNGLLTQEAAELIVELVNIVRIAVPILLIILCSTDFVSIVTGQDEKVVKVATGRIVKRFIAAAAFFFVPLIVSFILGIDVVKNSLNLVDDPLCGIDDGSIDDDGYLKEEEVKDEYDVNDNEETNNDSNENNNNYNNNGNNNSNDNNKENNNANNNDNIANGNNDASNDGFYEEQEDNSSIGNVNNIYPNYKSISVTNNLSKNYYKSFTYWLYLPNKVIKNLPIILYLPGLGERGNDYFGNSSIGISWGPLHEVKKYNYSYNAIIVVPQVPSEKSVTSYTNLYIELVNKIADEFDANKNKISVMGFSHGCYGLLKIVNDNQKYFSAAVPIGCDPKKYDAKKFIFQPIWTFVGGGDGYQNLPKFVSKINEYGGIAKHTYVENQLGEAVNVHNVLTDSYSILRDERYNVINWMISQTK